MRTLKLSKVLSSLLILSTLAFSSSAAETAPAGPPTLFISPLKPDPTLMGLWQPAIGSGLAEMLATEIGKINKFTLLESTALVSLKDEIKLGEDGFVAEGEKVDKGGFAGADFMFVGTVTRFGGNTKGIGLGGFIPGSLGNLGIKTTKNEVRIDWRIVDAYSRKVIYTGNGEAAHTGTGFTVGVGVNGHGGGIGFDNKEFMGSGLGKATAKAVSNIVAGVSGLSMPVSGRQLAKAKNELGKMVVQQEAVKAQQLITDAAALALKNTPGKVLAAVNKTTLIVSLGSKHGFKNGDKLKLYEPAEIKDEKGNVVFSEDKLVGEVTIDAVNPESSKTTYTGDKEVKAGWSVKAN